MSEIPGYTIAVDKDRDGSFATAGDDISGDVFMLKFPIRIFRGRDRSRALGPVRAGSASLAVTNRSGDYSPGSAVDKGAPVRITATYDSTDYNLFTGQLERPVQNSAKFAQETQLPSVGVLANLVGVKVSTPLLESVTTDEAIDAILDAAGWPSGSRSLETGATTLEYFWADNEDALDAIARIANTEGPGARVGETGSGVFFFRNRHHILTEAHSTAIQATFQELTSPNIFEPFQYIDRRIDVANSVALVIRSRSVKATGVQWTGPVSVGFEADEVKTYEARRSDNAPFKSAITPVSATDFTVTAGSIASVTLDRTSGPYVKITITAGAGGATITGLQLRADAVTLDEETSISNTLDASASIAMHGPKSWDFAYVQEIAPDFARNLANLIVAYYKNGRAQVRFAVQNADVNGITNALERDLDDRVRVIETGVPVDDEFLIQSMEHLISLGIHRTTFTAEQAVESGLIGVWDSGLWDNAVWGV